MLEDQEKSQLEELARSVGLRKEALRDLIIKAFLKELGGDVFSGTWRGGDTDVRKGRRMVVQWPFKSALVKLSGENLETVEHPEGPKYRKMPDGDFLGFPRLQKSDIKHKSLRDGLDEALALDRRGRIIVLFDHEEYQRLLLAVKHTNETLDPSLITHIAHQAIMDWVRTVEDESLA